MGTQKRVPLDSQDDLAASVEMAVVLVCRKYEASEGAE
jgi:hypothetical protein